MPVGKTLPLKRSIGGKIESDTFAFEFAPRLASGETISSVVAVDQLCESGGNGVQLTLGVPLIAGTQVQFAITAPDNTPDGVWALSCLVTTSLNRTIDASGGLEIGGSS